MAKQTISKSQLHKANIQDIDLLGSQDFKEVELKDLMQTVNYLGAQYAQFLVQEADQSKSYSTGKGINSIESLGVKVNGTVYEVEIAMDKYMEFVSGGVDGWAKNRGGEFSFKGKGVSKKMIESVKEWLTIKGQTTRIKNQRSKRSITDAATQQAKTVAFMIKRQGIRPRKFIPKATNSIEDIVAEELGKALRVDIINNLN